MSPVPTVLKSDRSAFDKMLPVDDNALGPLQTCATDVYNIRRSTCLRQGLLEPEFYGDLMYNLKKIVGSNIFSAQFIKLISHYKKNGYDN